MRLEPRLQGTGKNREAPCVQCLPMPFALTLLTKHSAMCTASCGPLCGEAAHCNSLLTSALKSPH
eukprot:m.421717 g.421717  ORF g.421717 m.421717 type:complete len:65 (-) comp34727_c0_seq1:149-343(-)